MPGSLAAFGLCLATAALAFLYGGWPTPAAALMAGALLLGALALLGTEEDPWHDLAEEDSED